MFPRKPLTAAIAALAFVLVCAPGAQAQLFSSPRTEPEVDNELIVRLNRAEEQVRNLTGQVEELQHRNMQLQQQLQAMQGGGAAPQQAGPGMSPSVAMRGAAMQPPMGPQQAGGALPPPVVSAEVNQQGPNGRDVFNPNANPNAPGSPRPLGSPDSASQPLDLQSARGGAQMGAAPGGDRVATLPPSQSPKDEFDLGYGYLQRKDYAQAEDTLAAFIKKYPSDALMPEAQFWLGEARFQRKRFREAAEAFLAVSTKFDTSPKAPPALLRLGQSLAAMGEKESACATYGEIGRKYPNASNNVKQGVLREQKRGNC